MNKSKSRSTRTLTHEELAVFFNELALLYESGISFSEALYIMADSNDDPAASELCSRIASAMDQGMPPADAMAGTGQFPGHAMEMIRVGHSSGSMESVLTGLTRYYQRQAALSRSIRSAFTFPLIMVSVMFCVLLVLIVKVLPLFAAVYAETGASMPWILRMVTGSSACSAIIIVILALILALLILTFVRAGAIMTAEEDRTGILASLPVVRQFRKRMQMGSFADSMSLLMSGGIPVEQALDQVQDMSGSARVRDLCAKIQEDMLAGATFAAAAASQHAFDTTDAALIAAAEKAGHLDEMMGFIAGRYMDRTEDTINSLLGMIEPVLVIVMSLLIGSILLSIMLPLLNIMMGI